MNRTYLFRQIHLQTWMKKKILKPTKSKSKIESCKNKVHKVCNVTNHFRKKVFERAFSCKAVANHFLSPALSTYISFLYIPVYFLSICHQPCKNELFWMKLQTEQNLVMVGRLKVASFCNQSHKNSKSYRRFSVIQFAFS